MPPMSSGETKPSRESRLSRSVRALRPYQALVLLMVPLCVVEPLKLVAVAVAGKGHWIAGGAIVTVAYATSLLVVERLFRLVKPKLLRLSWFARIWSWYLRLRGKASLGRLMSWLIVPPAAPQRRAVKRERQ
jgi:hypothetical protein